MTKKNDKEISLRQYYHTEGSPTGINLFVRDQAMRKMSAYVRLVDMEVGWMGFIRTVERQHEELAIQIPSLLILEDVFLYEQEVSGGSVDSGRDTDIPLGSVLEWVASDECEYQISELRFFAHSHNTMGAYHSSVDTAMIDDWAATGLDWFISHVQNKKGEMNCRFDMFVPYRLSVPVNVISITDQNVEDAVTAEILKNVSVKSWGQQWQTSRKEQGVVILEENLPVGGQDMGSVEHPIVRHEKMDVRFSNNTVDEVEVRKEIVEGHVIHCSISGSSAAKSRIGMTKWQREQDYKKWLKQNLDHGKEDKKNQDPQNGQLELERSSRSIQRSDERRNGNDSPQDKDEQHQTQTQTDHERSSQKSDQESSQKKQSESKEDKQDKQEKKKETPQLTDAEKKESEIVIEADSDDKSLEDRLKEGLAQQGLTI